MVIDIAAKWNIPIIFTDRNLLIFEHTEIDQIINAIFLIGLPEGIVFLASTKKYVVLAPETITTLTTCNRDGLPS